MSVSTVISIWEWVKEPKNWKVLTFMSVALLVILNLKSCEENRRLQAEIRLKENNLIALRDTVRQEKLKNGDIQQVKVALLSDLKDLKELNSDLFDEVKKQKTQVFYLSKLTAELSDKVGGMSSGDSHHFDPVSGKDVLTWNFDTTGSNWSRSLNGFTAFSILSDCNGYRITPGTSFLENLTYNFSITTGLKESEKYPGSLEIFVNSTYPGMNFTDIQGSVVNPSEFKKYLPSEKPKNWSFGPYFGVGYGVTLQNTPQLLPTLNIGLGVQYKILSF